MGRAVLALVVGLLGVGGCTYESSDASFETASPDPRPVTAGGTGNDVCSAADDGAHVVADESFDLEGVRWVFCAGDDEVLSLRSVATGADEWEARALPISAEDTLVVTVLDPGRAWVTHDGIDETTHEHTWTVDGGVNWQRTIADESDE